MLFVIAVFNEDLVDNQPSIDLQMTTKDVLILSRQIKHLIDNGRNVIKTILAFLWKFGFCGISLCRRPGIFSLY